MRPSIILGVVTLAAVMIAESSKAQEDVVIIRQDVCHVQAELVAVSYEPFVLRFDATEVVTLSTVERIDHQLQSMAVPVSIMAGIGQIITGSSGGMPG